MRAWFGRMIRRHLIADDPWPEYSRLDRQDGRPAAAGPERRARAKYPDGTAGAGPDNAALRDGSGPDPVEMPGDSRGAATGRRKTEAASPATDAAVPRST